MKRDLASTARIRAAIKEAATAVGEVAHVPRVGPLDTNVFRAFARGSVPFIIVGLVEHCPLAPLTSAALRVHFGSLQVSVRHGDYVKDAFTTKREVTQMSLAQYLDDAGSSADLPAYLGNQPLPELNALCKWPPYFRQYGETRVWLGPRKYRRCCLSPTRCRRPCESTKCCISAAVPPRPCVQSRRKPDIRPPDRARFLPTKEISC